MTQSRPDPVAWMYDHAPLDYEPGTDDKRRAVALAHADRARGIEPVPLGEQEAEATLDSIASRGRDDFDRWLDSRPEADEPLTVEERDALADADIATGHTISLDQLKRELGHQAE